MKIADLKKIIERVEDSGFIDADVVLLNGVGKETPIAGWEFVTHGDSQTNNQTLRLRTTRSKT